MRHEYQHATVTAVDWSYVDYEIVLGCKGTVPVLKQHYSLVLVVVVLCL